MLHAFADAAAAFGDRTGGLCGWLRLRFDSAGRLQARVRVRVRVRVLVLTLNLSLTLTRC